MGSVDDQIKATEFLRREAQRKLKSLPDSATWTDTQRTQWVADWIAAEVKKMRGT